MRVVSIWPQGRPPDMRQRPPSREEAKPRRGPQRVVRPPMTLANMRANGVRELLVYCINPKCRRAVTMNVDAYADDVPVPSFGPRMVCTSCGVVGADARPNFRVR